MKQTLVLDSETFNATTVPINCAGCYMGLTVDLGTAMNDIHVTVYPEVSLNYLDWYQLVNATIQDEGEVYPDGVRVSDAGGRAFTLNTKAFKQFRVRINGGNGVDTIPVAIEMVARS